MPTNFTPSFKVASTLTCFRIVSPLSITANTVAYPEAITIGYPQLGVTVNDVSDITDGIAVKTHGIGEIEFNDTATSGTLVTADSNGKAVPFTAATAPTWYIGTLIGPSVAATGTVANVLINPGVASL